MCAACSAPAEPGPAGSRSAGHRLAGRQAGRVGGRVADAEPVPARAGVATADPGEVLPDLRPADPGEPDGDRDLTGARLAVAPGDRGGPVPVGAAAGPGHDRDATGPAP